MKAKGTFEVEMTALKSDLPELEGIQFGRNALDKTFHGDLEASSKGEMISAMTGTKGSAGYVAVEAISGSLKGAKGSFVMQHYGIMNRGEDRLELQVVPDSGDSDLMGLKGRMTITIKDGQHHYEFEYSID